MVAVCGKYKFLKKLVGMRTCGLKTYRPETVYNAMGLQPAATFVNYGCTIKITQ